MEEKLLYYNIVPKTVLVDSSVIVDDYTNSFAVINCGTTVATFNGIPLAPPIPPAQLGESISIPGNKGEIYSGRIDIAFPGTGAGNVRVILRNYNKALTDKPIVKL